MIFVPTYQCFSRTSLLGYLVGVEVVKRGERHSNQQTCLYRTKISIPRMSKSSTTSLDVQLTMDMQASGRVSWVHPRTSPASEVDGCLTSQSTCINQNQYLVLEFDSLVTVADLSRRVDANLSLPYSSSAKLASCHPHNQALEKAHPPTKSCS